MICKLHRTPPTHGDQQRLVQLATSWLDEYHATKPLPDARVVEAVSIMKDALQDSYDVRFLLLQTKEKMLKFISANSVVKPPPNQPQESET